jgi:hypothetical protein
LTILSVAWEHVAAHVTISVLFQLALSLIAGDLASRGHGGSSSSSSSSCSCKKSIRRQSFLMCFFFLSVALQVIQLAEDMVAAAAAGQGTLSQQPKAAGPTRALSKNHARAAVVPAADTAAAADAGAGLVAAAAADGDASEVVGEHPDYRVLRLASFAVTGDYYSL